MPTGYTAPVEDGTITTFPEFAKLCARSMMAAIDQRDEPLHAPLKLPEPCDYYAKGLIAARQEFERLSCMTEDGKVLSVAVVNNKRRAAYENSIKKTKLVNERYGAMLVKVRAWDPPTEDHEELKEFMISQLTRSVSTYKPKVPVDLEVDDWYADEIEAASDEVDYYIKKHAEEVERTADRREWIEQLLESIE